MSNWEKVSYEEIKKGQELIGLKKGELQIQLAKALVKIDRAIEYIETNKQDKEFKFQDRKYYSDYLINKILEILKGDSNE